MTVLARTTLGIFVKYPVAGQVKTRLAAELGDGRAAEIYAAFVADLVARFRQTADTRTLCFSPDAAVARRYFETLAAGEYELWLQPAGDLGIRLQQYFDQHVVAADDRVIVIGSDSPTLPREFVERAFDDLRGADCVLGPATDGGYYLVGMRARVWPLFSNIEWSGRGVLDETVTRVARARAKLALLPAWYDVDTPADLQVLAGHVRALAVAGSAVNLEATRRALGDLPVTP